ncbi:beta-1,3-galactosyltransferase 5-like isoform X2 [Dermacentor albipictus]|uniref:beta-1,3-galactosyltransferase 5-like isoform X2 n=1 Tax=Dermacentor albipictus TaxID=60249 RepID=UPI0031FC91D5
MCKNMGEEQLKPSSSLRHRGQGARADSNERRCPIYSKNNNSNQIGANSGIFPLRPSAWFQCRLKIVAIAAGLTLLAYLLLRLLAPVIRASLSETPLRWFPDPEIAKKAIPLERLYNKPRKYLINPQDVCPTDVQIDYLFMVYSAPQYVEARSVIRRTWATDAKKYAGNRVLFLFGKPSTAKLQSALEFESQQYGDIVQEDFLDTYKNLTLKTVMMLRWAAHHCPQARFVVKIDDDCFPNLANFYRAMHGQAEDAIYGELRHRDVPLREPTHKWYISREEFPSDMFPDYITGGMYAIGGRVVNLLYRVTGQVRFFRVEDMYLTGMCAERAGVARTNLVGTYNLKLSSLCDYKKAIYGHHVTPVEMNELWYAMRRLEYTCRRILFSVHLCYCRPVDTSAGLAIETPVF